MVILRAEGLTKVFELGVRRRRVTAVEEVSLSVEEGEVFGFVGPNGAGKTTTIKMLMGLIFPTRGRAWVFDQPIPSEAARARTGYLPEHPAWYEFLTGLEALELLAELSGVRSGVRARCEELLGLVGLSDAAGRQIRKYSKGMQQRLGIAQALVGEPAFVILDEPMSGLDPVGRKEVRDLILGLRKRGKTVFFSTHILPDVESLCDRVGVIMGGRIQAVGRIADLLSPKVRAVEVVALAPAGAREALGRGELLACDGERMAVTFADEEQAGAAMRAVLDAGGRVVSVTPHRETLEDYFVRRLRERAGEEPPAP